MQQLTQMVGMDQSQGKVKEAISKTILGQVLQKTDKWLYAYIRISPTELEGKTKEEKEESAEKRIKLQKDKIIKYVEYTYPNYKIKWFQDSLISGKSIDQRFGFQTMISEAKQNRPVGIIFTAIARFSRSLQDLLNVSADLKANNIAIIITEVNLDTSTPIGNLFYQILGAFAEFEKEVIRLRTNEGKYAKRIEMEAEGRNWGRPKFVVIDNITKTKKELDPKEVLRFRKENPGTSLKDIANHFHCSTKPIFKIIHERD